MKPYPIKNYVTNEITACYESRTQCMSRSQACALFSIVKVNVTQVEVESM